MNPSPDSKITFPLGSLGWSRVPARALDVGVRAQSSQSSAPGAAAEDLTITTFLLGSDALTACHHSAWNFDRGHISQRCDLRCRCVEFQRSKQR